MSDLREVIENAAAAAEESDIEKDAPAPEAAGDQPDASEPPPDDAPDTPAADENEPVEGEPDPGVEDTEAEPAPAPTAGDPQYAKAPQSWKADVREAWDALPDSVKAEVHRRERDVEKVMHTSAQARQRAAQIDELQREYAPALQAEGVDVLTATRNLMNTASRLRFGTPAERAQLTAQIVRSYGVDIDALGAALSAGPQPPPAPAGDPRVDRLLAELQMMRQDQVQRTEAMAQADIAAFSDGKDFFDDVREDMADILEMAARRGVAMTMEQAYERACAINPSVSAAAQSRKAKADAAAKAAAIKAAKAASSSVSGAPAIEPEVEPDDIRSSLVAAFSRFS